MIIMFVLNLARHCQRNPKKGQRLHFPPALVRLPNGMWVLRLHRPVVDTDIIDQAGPEGAGGEANVRRVGRFLSFQALWMLLRQPSHIFERVLSLLLSYSNTMRNPTTQAAHSGTASRVVVPFGLGFFLRLLRVASLLRTGRP
jgi:hypothetical protein